MSEGQPSWIGRTLQKRYQIESLLGSGGMASVYKATDPNLQRTVALKIVHPHLASQPEFVKRFKREAAAVARLHHPNIVPIYDFNVDQNVSYMVLAYLAGGSLAERLKRAKQAKQLLPLAESVRLMVTLCDAVEYAHEQSIIHRDIKPSNVLFDNKGQLYLADFGIARLAGTTDTMTVAGTPTYMSPEQARGDQNLDQRSDIYSLGVMLYEMVGGKPPFEGSWGSLVFKHSQEPVPDIRLLNPNIPQELVPVIEKALAKEPNQRFQSASEMASALRVLPSAAPIAPVVKRLPAPQDSATIAAPPQKSETTEPVVPSPVVRAPQKIKGGQAGQRGVAWVLGLIIGITIIGLVVSLSMWSMNSAPPAPISGAEPTLATAPESADNVTSTPLPSPCPSRMVLIGGGDFCLDMHEVSNAAYRECAAAGSCSEPAFSRSLTRESYYGNPEFDNYPVIQVNWQQANRYCELANKRLPSALEWDSAAQRLAWPSEEQITTAKDTKAVGTTQEDVTPEGVYDLAGNVREFVADSEGVNKVIKGKSFSPSQATSIQERLSDWSIGFRCAANVP